MKNIMVDNWFMEHVIFDLKYGLIHSSKSYADLLMAIVLWDNIYYPLNSRNWWNSVSSQVHNVLNPIDDIEDDMEKGNVFIIDDNIHSGRSLSRNEGVKYNSEILYDRALHYIELSSKNKCDYLPCQERQEFVLRHFEPKGILNNIIRLQTQYNLDKSIMEYYVDTYKKFLDVSKLTFKIPVLADFILNNTPQGMTPVDYALHLKYEGSVVRYRDYLSQLEKAFEDQNVKEIQFLNNCSDEAIADVLSLEKEQIGYLNANLFPTPFALIKYKSINANLFPTPSIAFEKNFSNSLKKIKLTFMRDLTDYAITKIKLW